MKLTLDVSKWRCGAEGKNKLGDGKTMLLNNEGYSCCLGQFALQLGIDKSTILNKENFSECLLDVNKYHENEFFMKESNHFCYYDSFLSHDLININDNSRTTYKEKIKTIKNKLEDYNIELEVVDDIQI